MIKTRITSWKSKDALKYPIDDVRRTCLSNGLYPTMGFE